MKNYFLNYLLGGLKKGRISLSADVLWWFAQTQQELGLKLPSISAVANPSSLRENDDQTISLTSQEIEQGRGTMPAPSPLQKRLNWVVEVLKLDAQAAFALSALCRLTQYQPFRAFAAALAGHYAECDEAKASLVGVVIGLQCSSLQNAISSQSQIVQLGLAEDRMSDDFAPSKLLLNILGARTSEPNSLMQILIGEPYKGKLKLSDFEFMSKQCCDVIGILKGCLNKQTEGAGALLYGEPGTGKTEFAALLGKECNARVIFAGEISVDQKEPSRADRLAHLAMLSALGDRIGRVIVVVDEAEDIFTSATDFGSSKRSGSKVFLNRLIENNKVPIVWITNHPEYLGEVVIRRMLRAVEFIKPNISTRKRIITQYANSAGLKLNEATLSKFAQINASPAVIASSIRAAQLGRGDAEMAISAANSLQKAIGFKQAVATPLTTVEYDPSLSSADIDLVELQGRVLNAHSRSLSFLFTGQSGTGKTAFARHLAESLDMEVLEKRASDLMSKYVGETEANIAKAFAQATDGNFFLIFDEADSFLSDRQGAFHSWEVSLVNEMLTWMERHPLPFAATSNLATKLDPAVYRRFLFKVQFKAMTPCQIQIAFKRSFSMDAPPSVLALENITPADFSLVERQAQIIEIADPIQLAEIFERESLLKPGARHPIGFH